MMRLSLYVIGKLLASDNGSASQPCTIHQRLPIIRKVKECLCGFELSRVTSGGCSVALSLVLFSILILLYDVRQVQ